MGLETVQAKPGDRVDVERFERLREERGFSYSQVAGSLGISRATLWRRLNGTHPFRRLEIQRLAEVFDANVAWLVGRDG